MTISAILSLGGSLIYLLAPARRSRWSSVSGNLAPDAGEVTDVGQRLEPAGLEPLHVARRAGGGIARVMLDGVFEQGASLVDLPQGCAVRLQVVLQRFSKRFDSHGHLAR